MENIQKIQNVIDTYDVKRKSFINDEPLSLYINRAVEHIYVINLEKDRIRRNYVITIMKKKKINFELIIVSTINEDQYAIIGNNSITIGETGCYLSHMYCLNDAIKNNYKRIIIFEDDLVLCKKFHENFENIGDLGKFDILMLGAADFGFHKYCKKRVFNNLYKPYAHILGTHAVLYSHQGVQEMYRLRINSPTYFDYKLEMFLNIFENSFYICFPNLVVSELSTTSLDHNFGVTDPVKENTYYKKCFSSAFNFHDYHFIYLLIFSNTNYTKFNINRSFKKNIEHILRHSRLKISIKYISQIDIIKEKIAERMCYDFFTSSDLQFIMFNDFI
jgi:GR25 family glycosyltransferase involved in LPS biosynthesis